MMLVQVYLQNQHTEQHTSTKRHTFLTLTHVMTLRRTTHLALGKTFPFTPSPSLSRLKVLPQAPETQTHSISPFLRAAVNNPTLLHPAHPAHMNHNAHIRWLPSAHSRLFKSLNKQKHLKIIAEHLKTSHSILVGTPSPHQGPFHKHLTYQSNQLWDERPSLAPDAG